MVDDASSPQCSLLYTGTPAMALLGLGLSLALEAVERRVNRPFAPAAGDRQ